MFVWMPHSVFSMSRREKLSAKGNVHIFLPLRVAACFLAFPLQKHKLKPLHVFDKNEFSTLSSTTRHVGAFLKALSELKHTT